ncbi:hypothetical protein, partial [Aeromonas veronii]
DWIGHTEYSETRIEQLDHIFNLIGITHKKQPWQRKIALYFVGDSPCFVQNAAVKPCSASAPKSFVVAAVFIFSRMWRRL